jgi:hypothetical protein
VGRDHGAGRRPGLGHDGGRSAGRSHAGPNQARHLIEQITSAQPAIFAQPAEWLRPDRAGCRAGAGIIGRPARNYETDQSAKLSIADTGTSFTAGQSLSSTDDKWLRKVGAEQKLFGGVSISGSIGETPLGTTNKSITAGFKQSW